MQTFENTVTIQRPAEEVFAFLADFENIPKWNYAIDETHKTSAGPVGVGTRYRQTRSVPGRSVEGFEVTVFEPARRLAMHGQIGPFRATISYELEARAGADTASQQRGTRCLPGHAEAGCPARGPQDQGRGGAEPRQTQAGPGR